jgi:uncharacterized protein (DUF486 family)
MRPIVLLTISNVFMTFAWYWHLQNRALKSAPLWIVVLASWGIAFFEYCFQVPGNRVGYFEGYSASQLKIIQEAITLTVFCLFAHFVMGERLTWNYYLGFALVLAGVFVVFHFNDAPISPAIPSPPQ